MIIRMLLVGIYVGFSQEKFMQQYIEFFLFSFYRASKFQLKQAYIGATGTEWKLKPEAAHESWIMQYFSNDPLI